MDRNDRCGSGLSRRGALAALGGALTASVAGCLGGGGESDAGETTPTPIALSGGKQDDQGGMVIGEHFGPNGQIFYRDHSLEGHDDPAWFHTLVHGLFPYYFAHEQRGWTATAIYVTDYSTVEYDLVTQEDRTFISTHVGADTFAPARQVEYVAGSDVLGGMGKELVPFSKQADLEQFTSEHGGRTVSFDDVDRAFLDEYLSR